MLLLILHDGSVVVHI